MSAQLTLQRLETGIFTAVTKRISLNQSKDGIAIGMLAAALIGLIVADTHPSGGSVSLPKQGMQAQAAAVSRTAVPVANVGVFTGTYENGLPVYRLPAVEVNAIREPQ
jgi:hypothetical protein